MLAISRVAARDLHREQVSGITSELIQERSHTSAGIAEEDSLQKAT
jgi:hypothetical protein